MRMLIIEDQDSMAQYLRKGFSENGFIVDLIHDGAEGFKAAISINYDLIIVDGMLPNLDGWSLVKMLRSSNINTPILFLSARDELADRIKGLENGADCYLKKPFAFMELLAQARSLLRRNNQVQNDRLQIHDLVIDLVQHKATRGGKKLDLTSKEFALLSFLARRKGEVLSRTIIVEQVWDMNFDSDTNVVDVHIRRLRSKVDDPFPKKLIQTIRGLGYSIEE